MGVSYFERLGQCLAEPDPARKVAAVRELYAVRRFLAEDEGVDEQEGRPLPIIRVGRPQRPLLVEPKHLPRRRLSSKKGHAALIHSIAHIEFNAINLALDAGCRFRGLPSAYYADWLKVAAEEAYHFHLLNEHLQSLGFAYGDFEAHDGLWQMAEETAHDPLVRMALIPRVLEARGLDVTPGMLERLERIGDHRAVTILQLILRDEITHVAVGSYWFNYLCRQRGLDAIATFTRLLRIYLRAPPKPPFHTEARLQAGFTAEEMALLEALVEP
ncbi:MAG: DUF455 family protein [Gammaproteobacteria bacterium]|nr:DUF455 family protein [Gammaproteobacteria bacterium]